MCVGLVTHFAQIGLVRCVNVHVLLSVTAVCKPSVAALELTLEGLFSWRVEKGGNLVRFIDVNTYKLNWILKKIRLCEREERRSSWKPA